MIKNIIAGRIHPILIIFFVSLIIRWITYYYYYYVYTDYGGMHFSPTADEASTYEILARHILTSNDLSHVLFSYRPPLQPLLIAFLYLISNTTNPLFVVFMQGIYSSIIPLLTYVVTKELNMSKATQFWSGLLLALDPASIIISMTLMAETLSNLFIVTNALFTLRLMKRNHKKDALAAGASIALATLARPTSIYYFIPLVLFLIISVRQTARNCIVLVLTFSIIVMPWYLRNQIYNNVFTYSTVGNFDLLFYGAVSVQSKATGQLPQELEEQFSYELDKKLNQEKDRESYTYSSKWKFLVSENPMTNDAISNMAFEIFSKYPKEYILTLHRPLIKIFAFTNYLKPISGMHILEITFNIILYVLTLIGILHIWIRKHVTLIVITIIPMLYFTAIPVLTRAGSGMDTRARTPFSFALAILAALSIDWIMKRLNKNP